MQFDRQVKSLAPIKNQTRQKEALNGLGDNPIW